MPERYFLDKAGAKTRRMQGLPGRGHIDLGRQVLAEHGVVPQGDADVYQLMFTLKYARVVEHHDGRTEVEHAGRLTSAQKRVLEGLERAGRRIDYVAITR